MSDLRNVSFSAGLAVNATTEQWGFEPLPSNLTFVNGTLKDAVNGTINGTIIIERMSNTTIGSIQLTAFIYILMSGLIILMMLPGSIEWIQAATGQDHRFTPSITTPDFPERLFLRQIHRYYPAAPDFEPLNSYAEVVNHTPTGIISAAELRRGRALLRAKYALECDILNLRHVYEPSRHILEEKKKQAEGARQELGRLVQEWLRAKDQWTVEEWELVVEISKRIPHFKVE